MNGTLTFLGTGTSMGVPTVGCGCDVCTSVDPKDRRLRPSVLFRWRDPAAGSLPAIDRYVVIDTGPDFREQALRERLPYVDAVIYTHGHADHIMGLDDLRPLSFVAEKRGGPIPIYADAATAKILGRVFEYTFSPDSTYPTRARVQLIPLSAHNIIHGVDFMLIPVTHGDQTIAGFRVGNAAYLTDVSDIPESSFQLLEGVDVLIVDALRHEPHPSHSTIEKSVSWAQRVKAKQTWFTHIAHELGHEVTNKSLPPNIQLAHDGLTVPVIL